MQVLIKHRQDVKLEAAEVSEKHIVLFQRQKGQQVGLQLLLNPT